MWGWGHIENINEHHSCLKNNIQLLTFNDLRGVCPHISVQNHPNVIYKCTVLCIDINKLYNLLVLVLDSSPRGTTYLIAPPIGVCVGCKDSQ